MAAAHGGGLSSTEGSHEHEMRTNHMDHAACHDRGPLEDGMTARTATQAMAEIRLAMGDAVEPLLQVIRGEIAQAAEARTALARIAATRLDGEVDEHGNDAAMASGDAVRVLDQVVRDARQAAGILHLVVVRVNLRDAMELAA